MKTKNTVLFACLALAASVPQTISAAITWPDIQLGGFASQGFLINTGHNDYLGNTSAGTFDFREYAFSASWSKGPFRVGAQAFGQKLGIYGNDQVKLDWASVTYQPAQWFGISAGRVKMPRGLYNESLDLDAVRPYVLLPQSVYDARLRDFNSGVNGAQIFGNLDFHRFGSLDYKAFYGYMPISLESGAIDYFNTALAAPTLSMTLNHSMGGTLFWNTPIQGLRIGYSYNSLAGLHIVRHNVASNYNYTKDGRHFQRQLISAEYTHGNWTFAAEATREDVIYALRYPGTFAKQNGDFRFRGRDYYVAVSRRMNSWLELGTYYSRSWEQTSSVAVGGSVQNPNIQGDFALSSRFDITDHLAFKIEGHYMDGAGKLYDIPSHPQPIAQRDQKWEMLAIKVTYTF